jgi:hypothetical protein
MSRQYKMEGPDVSQYEDHETVAREWSTDKIYNSCIFGEWQDEGPIIFASGYEDSAVLRLLLKRIELLPDKDDRLDLVNFELDRWANGQESEKMPTTLLRAIERQRPENVRLLLQHGADPNGVFIETQKCLARTFRRFWRSEEQRGFWPYQVGGSQSVKAEDVGKVSDEFVPLTDEELARWRSGKGVFWTQSESAGLDYSRDEMLFNAVVRAGTSTPEILDQLLAAGADVSAWMGPDTKDQLLDEEHLSSSELALSTPLHAAVASFNMTMLTTLLDRGFSPNTRALITGSCALTPCQYAIILGNTEAYSILDAHPQLDKTILTPILKIHILHFATAHLRLHLLQLINLPLSSVQPTALGQTLLHIACLPCYENDVQSSETAEQSIHEVRGLYCSDMIAHPPGSARYDTWGRKIDYIPPSERTAPLCPLPQTLDDELQRQGQISKLLVTELGAEQIGISDIHGNTALHYLAGVRSTNDSLIAWMREQVDGEDVWQRTKNMWGHTPQAIWDDNRSEKARAASDPLRNRHGKYIRGRGPRGRGRGA